MPPMEPRRSSELRWTAAFVLPCRALRMERSRRRRLLELGAGVGIAAGLGAASAPPLLQRASAGAAASDGALAKSDARRALDAARARFRASAELLDGRAVVRFEPSTRDGLRVALTASARDAARRAARVELPRRASGPARIEDIASGVRVDVTLRGAAESVLEDEGGIAVYRSALGRADRFQRVTADGAEDLFVFDDPPPKEELIYDVDLHGVAGLRLASNALELLDAAGVPRLRMAPPFVNDAAGARSPARVMLDGEGACAADTSPLLSTRRPMVAPCGAAAACRCRLRVAWSRPGLRYPALVDPAWTTTADMMSRRWRAAAVSLPDGRVLVTGGEAYYQDNALTTTEIFDPKHGVWSVGPEMVSPRVFHTATALGDGQVLVAGGTDPSAYLGSAEILGADGSWHDAGAMSSPRALHAAILLPDGRILVTGGTSGSGLATDTADTFSLSHGWQEIAPMHVARYYHTAKLLPGGRALIVGGKNETTALHSVELFDPARGAWRVAAPMSGARYGHAAEALADGRVLVTGGRNDDDMLADTEIFAAGAAPAGPGSWSTIERMQYPRALHTATRLLDGQVLIAGGCNKNECPVASEALSPDARSWSPAGALTRGRDGHVAALLPGGRVLVAGGKVQQLYLNSAEVFTLLPGGSACSGGGECASGLCAANVCCDQPCPGPCLACTTLEKGGGDDGVCEPVRGNPCSQGVCGDAGACVTGCSTDMDCAPHEVCSNSRCTPSPEVACDGHHTLSGVDGGTHDCSPYHCTPGPDAGCATRCNYQSDCIGGARCNADRKCVRGRLVEPPAGSPSGCAMSSSGSGGRGSAAISMLVALLGARRARRAPRSAAWRSIAAATLLVAAGALGGCTPPPEQPEARTERTSIDPEGGSITIDELTLTFPAGAVTEPRPLSITRLANPGAAGYRADSAFYRCDPPVFFEKPVKATFTHGTGRRPDAIFWSRYLDARPKQLPSSASGNTISAEVSHFSGGFAGADERCAHGVLGSSCQDASSLVACAGAGVVAYDVPCDCSGPDGDARCATVGWPNAPWPVGSCLSIARGYDDGATDDPSSHLRLLVHDGAHAIDLQDPSDCGADVPLVCNFGMCRVEVGCRGAEPWGESACIEELAADGNPTGRWQFAAHLASVRPGADGAVLLRHEPIGLMGATGAVDGVTPCGGKHLHLEQGTGSPLDAAPALPLPFPPNPPAGLVVCSIDDPVAGGASVHLDAPSDGAIIEGPIALRGAAQDPAGLSSVRLVMSWPGSAPEAITLCAEDCGGTSYAFDATLGPEYLGVPSGASLTLAIRLTGKMGLSDLLASRTIQWTAAPPGCLAGAPGPVMVAIPAPGGGTTCIDATEVTRAQYQTFLEATNDGQDVDPPVPACIENASYVPTWVWPPGAHPDLPVVGVDWCDAYAYCKWAGKRLCGNHDGGPTPLAGFADPASSQWMNACTSGGQNYFPYGDVFNFDTCNTPTTCSECSTRAGSMALCQPPPPYAGVFDLSGNVMEWEDSCDGIGNCRVRGGSYGPIPSSIVSCGLDTEAGRTATASHIGFRCCSP